MQHQLARVVRKRRAGVRGQRYLVKRRRAFARCGVFSNECNCATSGLARNRHIAGQPGQDGCASGFDRHRVAKNLDEGFGIDACFDGVTASGCRSHGEVTLQDIVRNEIPLRRATVLLCSSLGHFTLECSGLDVLARCARQLSTDSTQEREIAALFLGQADFAVVGLDGCGIRIRFQQGAEELIRC